MAAGLLNQHLVHQRGQASRIYLRCAGMLWQPELARWRLWRRSYYACSSLSQRHTGVTSVAGWVSRIVLCAERFSRG